MTRFTSIIFLVVLVAQISAKLGVEVWFYYNQAELAELYCENKNEPEMQCNGKCYLAKKLYEVEEVTTNDENQNQEERNSNLIQWKTDFLENHSKFKLFYVSLDFQIDNFDNRESRYNSLSTLVHTPPPKKNFDV